MIDEIKLAQDRLKALKDEGKQGTPVWKQLAKSLLGWQTALVVGITLLSSYGNELADWVKGLFKAKENIDVLKEALTAYNEALKDAEKDAQSQLTKLKLLYDAATNAAKGTNERTKAIKALKEEYPSFFENMSNEAFLAGNAKVAYDKLSLSIMNYAKAQGIANKMIKNNEEIIDVNSRIDEAKKNIMSWPSNPMKRLLL